MPVNLSLPPALAVNGVQLACSAAGIKSDGSDDMVLFVLPGTSVTAGVFTQNSFCAAPVTVAKEHLLASANTVRAMLVNSGNANAGTGEPGIEVAKAHCEALSALLNCSPEQILPYSTGVIGQPLPDLLMRECLPTLIENLATSNAAWTTAAKGIMTTDTVPKATSKTSYRYRNL